MAASLGRDGRWDDALALLDRVEILQPGQAETIRRRVEVLASADRILEALQALTVMKARTDDVDYLLAEIGERMPAALERFNSHLAAGDMAGAEPYIAALAALLPGNAAIVNAALACNVNLGREDHVQKYLALARALSPENLGAQDPSAAAA